MLSREATDRDYEQEAIKGDLPLNEWAESLINQNTGTAFFLEKGRRYVAWRSEKQNALETRSISNNLSQYNLPVVETLNILPVGDIMVAFGVLPEGALPLVEVIADCGQSAERAGLGEALAGLLVHLHLAGFHFPMNVAPRIAVRRDGQGYTAFLINAIDGELLEDNQDFRRAIDLQNMANVLEQAWRETAESCSLEDQLEYTEQINDFLNRYRNFWNNISRTDVFADEKAMVTTRVMPMSETNLESAEMTRSDGFGFMLRTRIVTPKHHKMMLHMLTGLVATGNNGARRVLADISRYRSWLEFSSGRKWSKALAANHWMNEVYYPAVNVLPLRKNMATV